MHIRHKLNTAKILLTLASAATSLVFAHDAPGEETVKPVMKQALSEAPGKNALLVTVSYAPGQASRPHLHPGSIFAYVLEGSVVSQLEGEAARTYTVGQSWYEPPRVHHLVSRNASKTRPAKLLVFAVTADGEPVKLPLDSSPR